MPLHPDSSAPSRVAHGAGRQTNRWLCAVLALALALTLAGGGSTPVAAAGGAAYDVPSAARDLTPPRPLIWQTDVADPAVVEYYGGLLVAATGPLLTRVRAPGARGPWTALDPAMVTFPSWVLPGDQWAPDLVKTDTGWVLYYSAKAAGLDPGMRCIGAATAPTATGPFVPVGDAPLVCPPREGWPAAQDQLRDRATYLPDAGVIDASVFRERNGRLFLLYKTQGMPSTVRMVKLTPDGLHTRGRSRAILHAKQTVENPVMVRSGKRWVLLVSEGPYTTCDYRTTYRRSGSRWRFARSGHPLLGPALTGLCGPGGADLLEPRDGRAPRIFFHAWVCQQSDQPCPRGFSVRRDRSQLPRRALYAAKLRFDSGDRPVVGDFLAPH